jgi:hypothetical protein
MGGAGLSPAGRLACGGLRAASAAHRAADSFGPRRGSTDKCRHFIFRRHDRKDRPHPLLAPEGGARFASLRNPPRCQMPSKTRMLPVPWHLVCSLSIRIGGHAAGWRFRRRGSMKSCSQSPMTLRAITVSIVTRPGRVMSYQALAGSKWIRMMPRPEASMARGAPPFLIPPRSPRVSRKPGLARPFPRPQGSDTIAIACSPAVQCNPFYPAGQFP